MDSKIPPLLLIHGIDDTADIFDKMVDYLADRGLTDVHRLNLYPSNGDIGLDALARQVQDYVDRYLGQAPKIDLLGFSMGGIIGRYYLQRLGGNHRVQRFITLSSPHNGTWTGYLRSNLGASQMRPHSTFLNDLNSTLNDLTRVEFISLWTPFDLMILPADSSQLAVGKMIKLPVLSHPQMVTDERVLSTIAELLSDRSLQPQSTQT